MGTPMLLLLILVLLASLAPAVVAAASSASASSSAQGGRTSPLEDAVSVGKGGAVAGGGRDNPQFLALGDWGGSEIWPYTTKSQIQTARGMSSVASAYNSSFVLALGDNFYSHGIPPPSEAALHASGAEGGSSERARRRFESTFENVYGQESLQVPWYVTAGNHDHLGNVSAQMDFSQIAERWIYPKLFYSIRKEFTVEIEGDGIDGGTVDGEGARTSRTTETIAVSVEIMMIDTVRLAGLNPAHDPSHPSYFDPPPGPSDPALATSHLHWISRKLRKSDADYLFVAGHYPIYSACSHGNTLYLIENLDPLLKQHGATAYLSGHDHCQMHITSSPKRNTSSMAYILTGTGDECCYPATNIDKLPEDSQLRYLLSEERNPTGSRGGFASFEIVTAETGSDEGAAATTTGMTVRLHDENGEVLYETQLSPRRKQRKGGNNDIATGAAAAASTAAAGRFSAMEEGHIPAGGDAEILQEQ